MLPPQLDLRRVGSTARRAEDLGYDVVACGEHVFFHGPSANAFVALAAAAGATRRIRLLSALTILPVYPVALAAKMAATLDLVSGGRFEFGVGVGGEYPAELTACRVPPSERGARTDEALAVLARLFAGEQVDHDGRTAVIDGQRLDPLPVQRPGPPMWIGGRSEPAIRRAGRHGDVWLPYMVTPARLASSLERVRGEAANYGRHPTDVRGAVLCWSVVDDDGEWARRTAIETTGAIYRQDFGPLADRYLPAGRPEQVLERLREYADAGAETIVLAPACPDADLDRVIDAFARDVAPALRAVSTTTEEGTRC